MVSYEIAENLFVILQVIVCGTAAMQLWRTSIVFFFHKRMLRVNV